MNFQEIVQKIIIEGTELLPENITELYKIFKNNGYLHSEEEFYEDFLNFFYDNSKLIEENSLSVSGGSNCYTRIGSEIVASLISLGLSPNLINNDVSAVKSSYSNNNSTSFAQPETIDSQKSKSQNLWNKILKFFKYSGVNKHDALVGLGAVGVLALGVYGIRKLSPPVVRFVLGYIAELKKTKTATGALNCLDAGLSGLGDRIKNGDYDKGGIKEIKKAILSSLTSTRDRLLEFKAIDEKLTFESCDNNSILESDNNFDDFIDFINDQFEKRNLEPSLWCIGKNYTTEFKQIVVKNMFTVKKIYEEHEEFMNKFKEDTVIQTDEEPKKKQEDFATACTGLNERLGNILGVYPETNEKKFEIEIKLQPVKGSGNSFLIVDRALLKDVATFCSQKCSQNCKITVFFENCCFEDEIDYNYNFDYGRANLVFAKCHFEQTLPNVETKGNVAFLGNCTICPSYSHLYGIYSLKCRKLLIPAYATETSSKTIQIVTATEEIETPVFFYSMTSPTIICTNEKNCGSEHQIDMECDRVIFPNLKPAYVKSVSQKIVVTSKNANHNVLIEIPQVKAQETLAEFGENILNGNDKKLQLLLVGNMTNINTDDRILCGVKNTDYGSERLTSSECTDLFSSCV